MASTNWVYMTDELVKEMIAKHGETACLIPTGEAKRQFGLSNLSGVRGYRRRQYGGSSKVMYYEADLKAYVIKTKGQAYFNRTEYGREESGEAAKERALKAEAAAKERKRKEIEQAKLAEEKRKIIEYERKIKREKMEKVGKFIKDDASIKLTVAEIKEALRSLGVSFASNCKKAELIVLLKANYRSPKKPSKKRPASGKLAGDRENKAIRANE